MVEGQTGGRYSETNLQSTQLDLTEHLLVQVDKAGDLLAGMLEDG